MWILWLPLGGSCRGTRLRGATGISPLANLFRLAADQQAIGALRRRGEPAPLGRWPTRRARVSAQKEVSRVGDLTGISRRARICLLAPTVSELPSGKLVKCEPARVTCGHATGSRICPKRESPISGLSLFGADDGNRTRVFGLGSGRSAIELHLQVVACLL